MDRPPLAVRHDLEPHPEGGWYRQTWVADTTVELAGDGPAPDPAAARQVVVGTDEPQGRVPAGVWQRTLVAETDALVSCLVSPGFDFEDFELA